MKKYKYKSIIKWGTINENDFIDEMNKSGDEGWELVSVISCSQHDNVIAYFKKTYGWSI